MKIIIYSIIILLGFVSICGVLFLFRVYLPSIHENIQIYGESYEAICGPYSLFIVCHRMGVEASLEELSYLSDHDASGTSLLGLYRAARKKGLDPILLNIDFLKLRQTPMPCIAFVRNTHFLVVEAVDDQGVSIIAGERKYIMTPEEFKKIWSGRVIAFGKGRRKKLQGYRPRVLFDETVWDFGKVKYQRYIEHSFRFKNIGNSDLIVLGTSSCSKGISSKVLGSSIVPPGETGNILISLLPQKVGELQYTVRIFLNDPEEPIVSLKIVGISIVPVKAIPLTVLFGKIVQGDTSERNVVLWGENNHTLELITVKSSSNYILVENQMDDTGSISLTIRLSPQMPIGTFSEKVIAYVKGRKVEQVEIAVQGEIVGEVAITPDQLFFGTICEQDQSSRAVTISAMKESTNFEVAKIDSTSKWVKVELLSIIPQKKYLMNVRIDSGAPIGVISDTINIYLTSLPNVKLTLPVFAFVSN